MAQNPLGPPPFISQENSFDKWMRLLWQRIAIEGQILWTQVIRPTVVKNTFFAGPTTGADTQADFRTIVAADLGTGTPDGTKFLRDDLTWQVPSGGVSDGDKGDISVSGSGATWTIDNDVVTYSKMQNVSATSRILGRKTAAAGDAEECTLSEVLDFIGSAAHGDILYRGASSWARLGAGTSGQYLKTLGTGANPAWDTPAGSGTSLNNVISSATTINADTSYPIISYLTIASDFTVSGNVMVIG